MTLDPDMSAKVSRYKWEAYRDTNWWCFFCLTIFGQEEGILVQKYCNGNGRCIAMLSKVSGSGGRFDPPD